MVCRDLFSQSIGRTLADFGFVYMDPTMQGCGLISAGIRTNEGEKESMARLSNTRSYTILLYLNIHAVKSADMVVSGPFQTMVKKSKKHNRSFLRTLNIQYPNVKYSCGLICTRTNINSNSRITFKYDSSPTAEDVSF